MITKEFLEENYLTGKMSAREIGEKFNINRRTVFAKLRKYQIRALKSRMKKEDYYNEYFNYVKKRAGRGKRKIEFSITTKDLNKLFLKQKGRCALTGRPILIYNDASLDRIDPHKGYTKDNVQWVHKDVNTAKWDFQQEQFIQICKDVANHVCAPTLP